VIVHERNLHLNKHLGQQLNRFMQILQSLLLLPLLKQHLHHPNHHPPLREIYVRCIKLLQLHQQLPHLIIQTLDLWIGLITKPDFPLLVPDLLDLVGGFLDVLVVLETPDSAVGGSGVLGHSGELEDRLLGEVLGRVF